MIFNLGVAICCLDIATPGVMLLGFDSSVLAMVLVTAGQMALGLTLMWLGDMLEWG